ncbi:MAG: ABC transporter ATP-binding protein [Chloroflexi bacterium]|nr:ABC transporter ATP-binding protein [Chloroflexota bacterium]
MLADAKATRGAQLQNEFVVAEAGEVMLEAKGITKRFPNGVLANDHIDFTLKSGEVHAVLGENGAGKTTLMCILFGLLQPDEGEISIRGQKMDFRSPLDAIEAGIGMVHQHRKLIPAHSVIENIILGHPQARGVLKLKQIEEEVAALAESYGFKVDLRAKVWQLSEGEKQVVEILKALYRGAKILILDEPTSALTPVETEKLLDSILKMTRRDLGVVPFITHKLPIVLSLCDHVTVLQRGKVTARLQTCDATEQILAKKMVGREVIFNLKRPEVPTGAQILKVENLSARNNKGIMAFEGVSFILQEGEIMGIAGVAGNGQHELAEVLAGLRKAEGGSINFLGQDITNMSILNRWRMGIGYTPAERTDVGSIGAFSLVDNIFMNYYFDEEFNHKGVLDYKKMQRLTHEIIEEFDVATPGIDTSAHSMSGGNLQKIIMGRVFSRKPLLLIANLPAQGLDVGATEFVQRKLLEARSNQAGIILISEELDEILSLSDWVAPMYEGKIVDFIPIAEAKKETIGAMMAGSYQEK